MTRDPTQDINVSSWCVLIHLTDSQIQGQPGRDGQGHHAVQQVQEHVPGWGGRLRAQPGAQQVSG